MLNDPFHFKDELNTSTKDEEPWSILVVDDDQDVHDATLFALKDTRLLGRPLKLYHSFSGTEAIKTLRNNPQIVVVLLDAVMESDDAGLITVHRIREELNLKALRIILRTGQPGQIPELETITRYDINDYKTKNELTRSKLLASIVVSLRSWEQIHRLENSRKGLEKIVEASNQFLNQKGIYNFAEGVITQIAGLFNLESEGIICASSSDDECESILDGGGECRVIAAAGEYKNMINHRVQDLKDPHIIQALTISLRQKTNMLDENQLTIFFEDKANKKRYATWIASSQPVRYLDHHLLEVFCSNLSLGAGNVELVNRLKHQAWEDHLLQIPNLSAIIEALKKDQLEEHSRYEQLVLLDIDGFGQINEMLGHEYADKVLKAFSNRLQTLLGSSIFIARIAANTFGLLGRYEDFPESRLMDFTSFCTPSPNGNMDLSLSIGSCDLSLPDAKGPNAVHNGFIALKRAKHQGRGQIVHYSRTIGENTRDRLILLQMMKHAFDENRFFVVFQPQFNLIDKKVFSFEALLRWKSGEEYISPERFIPLAEQSGLIVPMGFWVLRRSLRALKEIHQAGFEDLKMAINISTMQLRNKDFLNNLDYSLSEIGMDPQFIELEITESISIMGMDHMVSLLNEIRSRGISLAVDDFGTGYSSLSTIENWPVNRIKIDKTFIDQMEGKEEGLSLVDLVVPLCKKFNFRVLAEGVETEAQLQRLERINCDEIQGFLMGRPMTMDQLKTWLRDQ